MRLYIAQEIEQIKNDIERLRATLESPEREARTASPVHPAYGKASEEITVPR
jgi:hypothetical protein